MPSVAPGPATSALPGISLEMKSLWPHPRPSEPDFEFSQTPQVIHVHGKFEIRRDSFRVQLQYCPHNPFPEERKGLKTSFLMS